MITKENRQLLAKAFKASFGLRRLLASTALCAVAAAGWAQFLAPRLAAEEQRPLAERLRERGFEIFGGKVSNTRRDQILTADDVAFLSEARLVADEKARLFAFQWNGCNDETLRQLSQMKQLQLLDLEGAHTATGLAHLAELPELRALRLHGPKQEALSSLGRLRQLEYLELETLFNDTAFEPGNGNWTKLEKLHTLHLRILPVTENGLRQLKQLPALKSLSLLFCTGLTEEGLRRVGELNQLKELNFLNCQDLTDEGLRHLGGLKNLESISLVCDPGWDRTEDKFDERGRLVSSEHVNVGASRQNFSDAGFRHLSGLTKLKNLCVYSPRLTEEVFITTRKLPDLSLLYLGLCPANGMRPTEEMARWLDTVYPWEPELKVDALLHKVRFECEDASLEEFVQTLSKAGAPVSVKFSELEAARRLPVAPITARYTSGVPLRQVLEEVLESRQLGWVVSSDERGIAITTKEAAEKEKNRLLDLKALRENLKGEVLRAESRQADAYSVVEMFNEHTLDSFEDELWLGGEK